MTNLSTLYQSKVDTGDIRPDTAQLAVIPEFQRISDGLNAEPVKQGFFRKPVRPNVKGLYLWGGVGRGKSMVMDLFVESLGNIPKRRVHFHAFMQEIHAKMHQARQNGVEDTLAPVAADVARSVRILAFDEMQITDITDAMIVGRLFEALFAAGVTVVTTSNRIPDDLYKNGLNRQLFLPFIEIIKDKMTVWEMVSHTDYRQDRLQGGQVYFTPLGPNARSQMDAIWTDFTGDNSQSLDLKIKGRTLTIPAYHNGVGRACFFDLCGAMLGPGDYLAIAQAVKVLMLDDIPALNRSNFNEAKRFVTLIDALYEAQVRLICSAAAEPEILYLEGEGVFEFERTASRLREMQDKNWGTPAQ